MLSPVFYGSVNRWECDENDHLNVRFFAQKIQQTLQIGLIESGFATEQNVLEVCRGITSQHMRFIAEARMAVPMTGYFGIAECQPNKLTAVCELRNTATETVLANFLIEIAGNFSTTNTIALTEIPGHAGSRGIPATAFPYLGVSVEELLSRNCVVIGQGIIQAEECDSDGYLQNFQYVGRQSDAIPNLFTHFESRQRGDGIFGGAVLEYRMSFFEQLKCGERFKILSGVKSLNEKTHTFIHTLFNAGTGKMVAGSEALAISMDLKARKSIPIPEERRERMAELLISA